jgi:hypothetical protein
MDGLIKLVPCGKPPKRGETTWLPARGLKAVPVDEHGTRKTTQISTPLSMTSQMVPRPLLAPLTLAIEAMPSELVRQFTLLREVDAKYSGIRPFMF